MVDIIFHQLTLTQGSLEELTDVLDFISNNSNMMVWGSKTKDQVLKILLAYECPINRKDLEKYFRPGQGRSTAELLGYISQHKMFPPLAGEVDGKRLPLDEHDPDKVKPLTERREQLKGVLNAKPNIAQAKATPESAASPIEGSQAFQAAIREFEALLEDIGRLINWIKGDLNDAFDESEYRRTLDALRQDIKTILDDESKKESDKIAAIFLQIQSKVQEIDGRLNGLKPSRPNYLDDYKNTLNRLNVDLGEKMKDWDAKGTRAAASPAQEMNQREKELVGYLTPRLTRKAVDDFIEGKTFEFGGGREFRIYDTSKTINLSTGEHRVEVWVGIGGTPSSREAQIRFLGEGDLLWSKIVFDNIELVSARLDDKSIEGLDLKKLADDIIGVFTAAPADKTPASSAMQNIVEQERHKFLAENGLEVVAADGERFERTITVGLENEHDDEQLNYYSLVLCGDMTMKSYSLLLIDEFNPGSIRIESVFNLEDGQNKEFASAKRFIRNQKQGQNYPGLRHLTDALKRETGISLVSSPLTTGGIDASLRSASIPNEEVGGIDFRALPMTIRPMGIFSGLSFHLPQLSRAELERININSEMQQIGKMVQAGILPSGERIKELIVACVQKGEINARADNLLLCFIDICKLQEEGACESSPEFREALVIVDSQA